PLAPMAPSMSPLRSLISAPPGCGTSLPPEAAIRPAKKVGFSFDRLPSERLDAPIATAPHALPWAMSNRNMVALSSRCTATICPPSSTTTRTSGGRLNSRAFASACSRMVFACLSVSLDTCSPRSDGQVVLAAVRLVLVLAPAGRLRALGGDQHVGHDARYRAAI